jgi:diguanylate cyclase (GGDEF)-like protein/PAS domain S-box-containing protein
MRRYRLARVQRAERKATASVKTLRAQPVQAIADRLVLESLGVSRRRNEAKRTQSHDGPSGLSSPIPKSETVARPVRDAQAAQSVQVIKSPAQTALAVEAPNNPRPVADAPGSADLRRSRAALQAIGDAIVLTDRAYLAVVDVNEAATRMFDRPRKQLLAVSPEVLFGRSRAELASSWNALDNEAGGDTIETVLEHADGRRLQVELHRRAVVVDDTELVVHQARDISARRRAEQVLQRQSQQHEALAHFGHFALGNPPEDELYNRCAKAIEEGLSVELCRILGTRSDDRTLEHLAGTGWADPMIRERVFDAVEETQDRFVFGTRESCVIADFESQTLFSRPPLLSTHGVRSAVEVLVCGAEGPYGVVGAYAREPAKFAADSTIFMQSLANTLAAAIDRKNAEERLSKMAQFDALTGLPNRNLYLDRLGQTLIEAERHKRSVAVLFVDIDRFKNVNDSLGHAIGDLLLIQIAACLESAVRPGDTVGRLGGDEFTITLADLAHGEDAGAVTRKIVSAFSAPFLLAGRSIYVSATIGVCLYPSDGTTPEALLRNADTAMYRAKESGRNRYQFYLAEMNERAEAKMLLESALRGALGRNEYSLDYQPKVGLRSGRISGMEALLRWNAPDRGPVPPGEFVPILEETGLIVPVGEWVIRTVCRQIRQWADDGFAPLPVAVNLSARQFREADLDVVICRILAESGIDPALLELELTESTLMSDSTTAIRMLHNLKAHGIRLTVDDFGTGYSSLSYLKRFPIDALKIDREFIADVNVNEDGANISVAIISLAHSLKLNVVAEGVETQEQLSFLRANACDEMQGYYFARPMPVEEMTRMLREARHIEFPSFDPR